MSFNNLEQNTPNKNFINQKQLIYKDDDNDQEIIDKMVEQVLGFSDHDKLDRNDDFMQDLIPNEMKVRTMSAPPFYLFGEDDPFRANFCNLKNSGNQVQTAIKPLNLYKKNNEFVGSSSKSNQQNTPCDDLDEQIEVLRLQDEELMEKQQLKELFHIKNEFQTNKSFNNSTTNPSIGQINNQNKTSDTNQKNYQNKFQMNNENLFQLNQENPFLVNQNYNYHNNFNFSQQKYDDFGLSQLPTLQRPHSYSESYSLNNYYLFQNQQNFANINNNFTNNQFLKQNDSLKYNFNKKFQKNQIFNQKPEKLNIQNYLSNAFESCKDQNGSRMIQQQFELADEKEREQIFNAIKDKNQYLMKDVFGNYVIQKMIEKGNKFIKMAIFEEMKNHIVELTFHTYGCRVVQKALEALKDNPSLQREIFKELEGNILACVQDQNGNHVIQKCFETMPPQNLFFIIDQLIGSLEQLAFHAYGCRVIQRILEFSSEDKKQPILQKLMTKVVELCQCQYGNYIVQNIIEKGPEQQKQQVLKIVKEKFVELSLNKFASNVTEKSVIHSTQAYRQSIIDGLMDQQVNQIQELGILRMLKDAYGNYVIQKLYQKSDSETQARFFQKINNPEIINELRKSNYGKHALGFIEKIKQEQLLLRNKITI